MYVPDTSAIIAGLKLPPEEVLIPESVIEELREKIPDLALYAIVHADERAMREVKKAAKKSGDLDVLSRTDIEVLAVAWQEQGTIITDDYAIQNVASHMGIKYEPAGIEGIKEQRRWKWRCTGCGRYYRKYYRECPVCGSPLRRVKDR